MNEFYRNGWDDYYTGVHTNPYPQGTAAHESWDEGQGEAHEEDMLRQQAQHEEDAYYAEFDAVSQGYYDDDPSPYAGDYSEM